MHGVLACEGCPEQGASTTEMDYLAVLGAGSLRSVCLMRVPRDNPFLFQSSWLASGGFFFFFLLLQPFVFPGFHMLHPNLCLCVYMVFSLCASLGLECPFV